MINDAIAASDVIPKSLDAAEAAQFVMSLKDVGIVALALLVIVFVGGLLLKRFVLDDKIVDAQWKKAKLEGDFYDHMGSRLESMEQRLNEVYTENKTLIITNANLNARVMILEQHEAEVTKLRRIVDQKDDRISDMEIAMEALRADKELMFDRITQLERQISECKCSHSRE